MSAWTSMPPSKPGWYYWRDEHGIGAEIVSVKRYGDDAAILVVYWIQGAHGTSPAAVGGQWQPVPGPQP